MPGPEARRRRPARRQPSTALAEAGARQPSPPGQPTDITSGSTGFEDRLEVGRNGDGRVAGAGPDRRRRGHPHRPGQAARAAGDRHLAGAELGRAGAAARRQGQDRAVDRRRRRAATGRPPGSRSGPPAARRVPLAGGDPVPELGGVEADREVRFDRDPGDLAAGGVDAGGDVAGDDGRAAAVDRLDRAGGRLARRAARTRSRRSRRRPRPSPPARRRGRRHLVRPETRPPRPRSPSPPGGARQPPRRRRCCPCRRRSAPAPAAKAPQQPRPAPSRPPPSAPPREPPAPRSPSDRSPESLGIEQRLQPRLHPQPALEERDRGARCRGSGSARPRIRPPAASAALPESRTVGGSPATTSISRSPNPPLRPSALTTASLAAKRAARCRRAGPAPPRIALGPVKTRSARRGWRSRARSMRSISSRSMPTPAIDAATCRSRRSASPSPGRPTPAPIADVGDLFR